VTNIPAVAPRDGESIGPYRLDAPIGSGGLGTVWRAWDERLERWVALKQIRVDVALRHGRERLWREARAVARLNHPSIVHIYDLQEGTDGDWIVMELVELAVFGLESSLMPHVYQAWALWDLGEPDRAARKEEAILAIGESLRSPFILGMALFSQRL